MSNIDKIFKNKNTRNRAVDFIQLAKNTVDSYPMDIPHGVQKDAIQNGWDASLKKTRNYIQKNWKFVFKLVKLPDSKLGLSMIDSGTTGLTGNLTSEDISIFESGLPENERWARWESLAFTKESPDSLGARGQGKMIFISASRDHSIFYDSLRQDGSYRFGGTRATHTEFPPFHFEGDKGRKSIKEVIGLDPIQETGTRVIIYNPIKEVLTSLEDGTFKKYIEETWWPIILKYGAEIIVDNYVSREVASVPRIFKNNIERKENDNFKKRIMQYKKMKIRDQEEKIKKLCIFYDNNIDIPEIHQGLSYFRGGMKIGKLEFPALKKIRKNIYGFVEFGIKLEKKLREIESPNHYGFNGRYKLWREIKEYLEEQMEIFGNKKLGMGIDRRAVKNQRRSNAENIALSRLKKITKGWAFFRGGKGPGGGSGKTKEKTPKKIAIRLSNINFPNTENIPRVNYGDKIKDFYPLLKNETNIDIDANLKIIVLSGDRIVLNIEDKDMILKKNTKWEKIGETYNIDINEKNFDEPGEYRLRLKLSNNQTKHVEDRVTRRFWVEKSPNLKAPFNVKRYDFDQFPENFAHHDKQWYLDPKSEDRYTFVYNITHPLYLNEEDSEENLADYLTSLFAEGAMALIIKKIDIENIEQIKDDNIKPLDKDKFVNKKLFDIYCEIVGKLSIEKTKIFE